MGTDIGLGHYLVVSAILLVLGIFGIFYIFHTLDFDTVFKMAPSMVGHTFHFGSWNVDVLTTLCPATQVAVANGMAAFQSSPR